MHMRKTQDLGAVLVFRALGHTGSFTKAANSLGVPKSFVSRKISELESRLQVQLVQRTTRRVQLTNDGRTYFDACEQALERLEDAEKIFEDGRLEPSGHLRLTCPVEFGPYFTEQLCSEFLNRYPTLTLEVLATNTVLDFVRDQIDVAIRPMHLASGDQVAISIGVLRWRLFASPKWCRDNLRNLKSVRDLHRTDFLAFNPGLRPLRKMELEVSPHGPGRRLKVECQPRFVAGSLSVLIAAATAGAGVAALPESLVRDHVSDGLLRPVLPRLLVKEEKLSAVYLGQKHLPSRTRALVDHLKMVGQRVARE
jgi:DNA-binding transcriptional LysR family regulator